MSGHSKWAQIHRQKGVADQKRGTLFTKLGRAITVAAREGGGDPNSNFKLRLAIEKARQANMPKDNIIRAIKRGTGEEQADAIEEIIYEGFGPENVALIIKVLTDNKNRTLSNIKNILSRQGGKLGGQNSVKWMFEQNGIIRIISHKSQIKNLEAFQLELIEVGAEDFEENGNDLIIKTKIDSLQKVRENIESQGIGVDCAEIEFIPKKETLVEINGKNKIEKLAEALEENEDVEGVFTNAKV